MVADFQSSRRNASGKNAPGIELIHVLNRKAKRLLGTHHFLFEGTEGIEYRRALIPGHRLAAIGDVVAQFCAHRDNPFRVCAELREKLPIFLFDALEDILTVPDQVHLIHDHGELAYAQQGKEVAMLFRLFFDALQRIDQEQRRLRPCRTGNHVLEKLLVAGRIDDDVLAALPVEERPCGVDGDALLLLFEKGIEQERIFELFALLAANGLDLFQFAVRQRTRIGIEPSEQGGLAVIDVTDNHNIEMFGRCRRTHDALHVSIFSQQLHASPFVLCTARPLGHGGVTQLFNDVVDRAGCRLDRRRTGSAA